MHTHSMAHGAGGHCWLPGVQCRFLVGGGLGWHLVNLESLTPSLGGLEEGEWLHFFRAALGNVLT